MHCKVIGMNGGDGNIRIPYISRLGLLENDWCSAINFVLKSEEQVSRMDN